MGRAQGSAASPGPMITPGQRGRLSVVRGAEPPGWAPTTLERLMRALDLRQTGPRRFEVTAAEARWPAFPGALLVASAVVAAERSFPGYSVGHMSCGFGQSPRADHAVEIALSKIHAGRSCVTGRLTFRQGAAAHGEVALMLRSGTATIPDDLSPLSGPAPAPPPAPTPTASGSQRPQVTIVPWELLTVPGSAGPLTARSRIMPEQDRHGCSPAGCSWTWSRSQGAAPDGTVQRALLAYLSELLPIASAAAAPYPSPAGRAGRSATVLSHAITYGASFDLRDWMLAAVDGPAAGEGYVHALATFRTRNGGVAATVSQAAAVWDREATRRHARRSQHARHLMLSG
jgi:acyl-CoA thioesterase II